LKAPITYKPTGYQYYRFKVRTLSKLRLDLPNIAPSNSQADNLSFILKGVLYGLVLMFSAGPSFFYLIKVGIEKGFRKALGFALGILFSDLILLGLIYLGLRPLFENTVFKQAFSLASGILITVFGLTMILRRRPSPQNIKDDIGADQPIYKYVLRGMAINLLNPFTITLWVGILGSVSPEGKTEFGQFVAGLLGVIFVSDGVKAYLAKVIGRLLTPIAVFRLNKILGVAFVIIGAYFIYTFYQSFFAGQAIEVTVPDFN